MARNSLLGLSLLFHGALGFMIYRIDEQESRAATAIQVAEAKKQDVQKREAEPPKPPPEPPKRVAKRAAQAPEKTLEAPKAEPAPLADLPDFGLELSGSVGGIPIAAAAAATASSPARRAEPRALSPVVKRPIANAPALDPCDEPAAKPKPISVPQPAYTDRAREAAIEGKVRVELTVDETGRVVAVRVLQGLGYGLDEAAVAAAERARFEPAVRCGKPARATFTISMRFSAA